jgi:hypothetical protein
MLTGSRRTQCALIKDKFKRTNLRNCFNLNYLFTLPLASEYVSALNLKFLERVKYTAPPYVAKWNGFWNDKNI